MDTAASSSHKEMYKVARSGLTDRVMPVRTAAAKSIVQMTNSAPFLFTTELESLTTNCFRALDGADYDARIAIADLLGCIISCTQQPPTYRGKISSSKINSLRLALNLNYKLMCHMI
jgi:hypothetical protein